jgi:hypothetical protein
MLNTYLLEPFSNTYRVIPVEDHRIADEILLNRPTLRQRVGLRLIHIGHQLRGPEAERLAA